MREITLKDRIKMYWYGLKLNPKTDRMPMWEMAQDMYKEDPTKLLSRPNLMKRYQSDKKPSGYGSIVYKDTDVLYTMSTQVYCEAIKLSKPYYLNDVELCLASSFPLDYKFELGGVKASRSKLGYAIAMAIPPVMSQAVSEFVYENIIKGNK